MGGLAVLAGEDEATAFLALAKIDVAVWATSVGIGVNLTTLHPGAWSSQRHWHEKGDEFVYVLEGEIKQAAPVTLVLLH
jgi:quercetin dioxygenase-like cupin family protein